jgi:hypothetical protein
MAKRSCQDMLEDLLYDAVDAGAANRDVNPHMIGKFVSSCVRPDARGGLARRPRRATRRRSKR